MFFFWFIYIYCKGPASSFRQCMSFKKSHKTSHFFHESVTLKVNMRCFWVFCVCLLIDDETNPFSHHQLHYQSTWLGEQHFLETEDSQLHKSLSHSHAWPINNARHTPWKSDRDCRWHNIHGCVANRRSDMKMFLPNTHGPSAWNLWWLALAELAENRMLVVIMTETATGENGQFRGCIWWRFAQTTATRLCLSGPEFDHQLAVELARLPNRDAELASCSQNINWPSLLIAANTSKLIAASSPERGTTRTMTTPRLQSMSASMASQPVMGFVFILVTYHFHTRCLTSLGSRLSFPVRMRGSSFFLFVRERRGWQLWRHNPFTLFNFFFKFTLQKRY